MAPLASEFPLPSITAGIREMNSEGEKPGAVDVEDCLSFLIQETRV